MHRTAKCNDIVSVDSRKILTQRRSGYVSFGTLHSASPRACSARDLFLGLLIRCAAAPLREYLPPWILDSFAAYEVLKSSPAELQIEGGEINAGAEPDEQEPKRP